METNRNVTKRQFVTNSLWKILEQFSAKGISMIVSIILARLLMPNDYGLIALTAVFTNLSDILIDGGFGTALIRKETVDDYDYSAVFSISSSISILLYLILFFAAPAISNYYEQPMLTSVLRVIGLTFFIQAFTAVRNGIVNRNMQFRLLFFCNSVSSIISGVIGIISAYLGFGVWALVIQRLSQQTILTFILFIKVKWKIKWQFDLARIKEMFSFSIGVVGSSLLNFAGGNIYSIVIGKKYSVTDLGYYDKGGQLPMQASLYTFGAMSNVLLPTISSCQSDLERVKRIIRKVVVMTSFLIMPLMAGLALASKEVICLLFTEKWLQAVPIVPSFCLYYLATPYMLINIQIFFALGHSQLRVKTEIIRLILMAAGLGIFGFVLNCTMTQLAFVGGVIAALVAIVTYIEARKLIDYTISEVVSDMIKPVICTAVMSGAIYAVSSLTANYGYFIALLIKIGTGIITYLASSLIIKSEGFQEMLYLVKGKRKNPQGNNAEKGE